VRPARQEFTFPDEPFLRQFFGEGLEKAPLQPRRQGGLGSGVIVSQDGYILTNHHVIKGAQRIEVDLADRRTLSAKLVGSDAASDLAVLKVDAKDLVPLPFGDSNAARVGDVVLAFGNPLGVGQTVTMGIISAKGRATDLGDGSFEDFLQTDAPINQGNSGGALVNVNGELVGINSQIVSPSGGSIGIGFAIPSAMADNVMRQLIHGGHVRRGRLGVTVQAVTSDLAKGLGLSEVKGALVSSVVPGGPADEAGVERGDVIVRLDGNEIEDSNALRNQISSTAPDSKVALTVLRGGHQKTISVRLGELEDKRAAENEGSGSAEGGKLGLVVRPVSPGEARALGLPRGKGLTVAGVDPEGPAAASGFRPGDVIEEVDGQPVSDARSLSKAVQAAGTRPALVLVGRKGENLFLTLQGRG
jgi:serine protease Do